MIRFLKSSDLQQHHVLRKTMFQDRAFQFSTRLQWDVEVNDEGEELDEYDSLDPVYVIVQSENGQHQGSMRLLPTIGRTMVNDHFSDVTGGIIFRSRLMWECSRFCVSKAGNRKTAPKLLAAGGKFLQEFGIQNLIGVFDQKMERVYRALRTSPFVVGQKTYGAETIGVGLWQFNEDVYSELLKLANMSQMEMELFFANSKFEKKQLATAV